MLAGSTLKEMHTARYLGNEEWTEAWGITWYAIRKDGVTWVQHSGGLHGFITNVCFDPKERVGAIVLLNGGMDAADLSMALGAIARTAVLGAAPVIEPPEPTPDAYRPLLGLYLSVDLGEAYRLEWRDAQLVFVDPGEPTWRPTLSPTDEPDVFTVDPGVRESGERVVFNRTRGRTRRLGVHGRRHLGAARPGHSDGASSSSRARPVPGSRRSWMPSAADIRSMGEPAREVLAEQRAIDGDGTHDRDRSLFVALLLQRSVDKYEAAQHEESPVMFDRGIPDCITYAAVMDVDPTPSLEAARRAPLPSRRAHPRAVGGDLRHRRRADDVVRTDPSVPRRARRRVRADRVFARRGADGLDRGPRSVRPGVHRRTIHVGGG